MLLWIAETILLGVLTLVWIVIAFFGGKQRASGWFSSENRPVSQLISKVLSSGDFYIVLAGGSLLMLVLQTSLLWPVRLPRARRERGRSMWISIIVVAGSGMTLAAGGFFLILSLVQTVFGHRFDDGSSNMIATTLTLVVIISWLALTPAVWLFVRGRNPDDAMTGLTRRLFAGGAVEFIVAIPVDVLVRRKTDCYCGEGSLVALIIATSFMLVTAGPLALLIALRARRQAWWRTRCSLCNYDLAGLPSAVCPECGQKCGQECGPQSGPLRRTAVTPP